MRDRLLFVFAALMFCTMPAAAQQTSIVGTATDETKAVLPGVTVTAVELSTGAQFVLVRIGTRYNDSIAVAVYGKRAAIA